MHIDFLVEDSSGARLMEILLPKLLGKKGTPHTWQIRSFKGVGRIPKNLNAKANAATETLLEKLPKLLKGYENTPGREAVFVLVDSDKRDPAVFEADLVDLAVKCGRSKPTEFGIATEEIEAWYLGDRKALRQAYPRIKSAVLKRYEQDAICGTWEMLADALVKGGSKAVKEGGWIRSGTLKHEWAEHIGPHMQVDINTSPSFNKSKGKILSLVQVTS